MSIATDLIDATSLNFDDSGYPLSVYYTLLRTISEAGDPATLGKYLAYGLAWKDGKTRIADEEATACLLTAGGSYTFSETKPSALNDEIRSKLANPAFFQWAQLLRQQREFTPETLDAITRFDIWQSGSVMYGFVLHLLLPTVYRFVDQDVIRASSVLECGIPLDAVNAKVWHEYHVFFERLLDEYRSKNLVITLERVKGIDNGLRALGKMWKGLSSAPSDSSDGSEKNSCRVTSGTRGAETDASSAGIDPAPEKKVTTGCPEFKKMVMDSVRSGLRQFDALQQAASHFELELPASYRCYPGSHIDRYRKQGF